MQGKWKAKCRVAQNSGAARGEGGRGEASPLWGVKGKVKFSHTRYRALGPELIPVYRQSARR